MISQNRVLAIIVTFNRLDLLKGAIGSLHAQTFPCDILVINNGSTDGTESYLSSLTDVQVINQENIGGAGGFHTGLKYAAEHGYEFGWVMDDDVVALPDCLFQLISQYDRLSDAGEKIGFLCSKVENVDGLTVNVPFVSKRLNATGYAFWNQHLADGLVGVEAATFVSVLIPCERVREMGLPYKAFFIWGDDSEYTMRLSRDFLCYQVGRSRIKHLRVGSTLSIYIFYFIQ